MSKQCVSAKGERKLGHVYELYKKEKNAKLDNDLMTHTFKEGIKKYWLEKELPLLVTEKNCTITKIQRVKVKEDLLYVT